MNRGSPLVTTLQYIYIYIYEYICIHIHAFHNYIHVITEIIEVHITTVYENGLALTLLFKNIYAFGILPTDNKFIYEILKRNNINVIIVLFSFSFERCLHIMPFNSILIKYPFEI